MAKIYTKNTWVDEVLAGAERYNILTDAGATVEANAQIALATGVVQAGTAVNADRMNNIENGIDALDTLVDGLASPALVDYSATSTVTGWSSFTTKKIYYRTTPNLVWVAFQLTGTSNAATASFTLPYAAASALDILKPIVARDSTGWIQTAIMQLSSGASVVSLSRDVLGTGWTASGDKRTYGEFMYSR